MGCPPEVHRGLSRTNNWSGHVFVYREGTERGHLNGQSPARHRQQSADGKLRPWTTDLLPHVLRLEQFIRLGNKSSNANGMFPVAGIYWKTIGNTSWRHKWIHLRGWPCLPTWTAPSSQRLSACPEKMKVTNTMMSPYQQKLVEELGVSISCEKLVPNLMNKSRYVVHYRNLQLYLSLGMKLVKVHKVLQFQQSPWMAPYIAKNTKLRTAATNDFEKDFFKLMNNAVSSSLLFPCWLSNFQTLDFMI